MSHTISNALAHLVERQNMVPNVAGSIPVGDFIL